MSYEELEKLYQFTVNEDVEITKHDVKTPKKEDLQKLVDNYSIKNGGKIYIQILSTSKIASFVTRVGELTLYDEICSQKDEFTAKYNNKEIGEF